MDLHGTDPRSRLPADHRDRVARCQQRRRASLRRPRRAGGDGLPGRSGRIAADPAPTGGGRTTKTETWCDGSSTETTSYDPPFAIEERFPCGPPEAGSDAVVAGAQSFALRCTYVETEPGWSLTKTIAVSMRRVDCDTSVDSDGDGVSDCAEFEQGTDASRTDTDGDGMPDGSDGCWAGLPTWFCGQPPPPSDRDGDGTLDTDDPCPDDATNTCRDTECGDRMVGEAQMSAGWYDSTDLMATLWVPWCTDGS